MTDQLLNVGKIVGTHGVKGEVRVFSLTDSPDERYQPGSILYLFHPAFKFQPLSLTIENYRQHKKLFLLKFEGYNNINDVENWKDGILKVKVDENEQLEEGEFYFYQIIGCDVYTTDGEKIGVIKDIIQTGANDVWVISPLNGTKDILIPYIEECVKDVNIDKQKVIIHLMEGLV